MHKEIMDLWDITMQDMKKRAGMNFSILGGAQRRIGMPAVQPMNGIPQDVYDSDRPTEPPNIGSSGNCF